MKPTLVRDILWSGAVEFTKVSWNLLFRLQGKSPGKTRLQV
jgi:hypothetical protein